MRIRLLVLVALALVASSCGASPSTEAAPTPRPLAYSLTGDVELVYDQTIEMDASMSFGGAFGELDPNTPDQFDMAMVMGMRTGYRIEEATEPGTFRVAMELSDLRFESGSVVVDGEEIEIPDEQGVNGAFGPDLIPEMEFVITEKGELLSMTVDGESVDVAGLFGGDPLSGFAGPAQLFGPELPAGDVAVGSTWTSSYSRPIVPGREVTVSSTHRILREETFDGHATWVIETESSMGQIELTMADLMAAAELYGASDQELGAAAGMDMRWRMDPSETVSTAWLDPAAGVVRHQVATTDVTMSIEMSGIPGAPGPVTIDASTSMRQTMTLAS